MSTPKLNDIAIDRSRSYKKRYRDAKKAIEKHDSRVLEVAINLYDYIENTPGMSRAILSEKLGVSQAYICKLINGKINPSLRTLEKYEKILGTKLLSRQGASTERLRTNLPSERIYSTEVFSSQLGAYNSYNYNGHSIQISTY